MAQDLGGFFGANREIKNNIEKDYEFEESKPQLSPRPKTQWDRGIVISKFR
jgi:hypothetical protein